jgi:hypothetical protein
MHYLKYLAITILLYVAQTNAICLTDNLEKIDNKQIASYLEKQPYYERQSVSNIDFIILSSFVILVAYFADQKMLALPLVSLFSFLHSLSNIGYQTREARICNTYYNNILRYNYLAKLINKNLADTEMFLFDNNCIGCSNKPADSNIELFCTWIILYRRDLRSSFLSVIDREKRHKDFNVSEIMAINVSSSNRLSRYSYLEKIKFDLIASNQTIEAKFLVNTLQQSGIHLITNNNHKYVGIINNQDECYLLFGVELDKPKQEESKSIVTKLQNQLLGSEYIDPECYALIIKFNPEQITQTIASFLCKYFGLLAKVDLYEVSLIKH